MYPRWDPSGWFCGWCRLPVSIVSQWCIDVPNLTKHSILVFERYSTCAFLNTKENVGAKVFWTSSWRFCVSANSHCTIDWRATSRTFTMPCREWRPRSCTINSWTRWGSNTRPKRLGMGNSGLTCRCISWTTVQLLSNWNRRRRIKRPRSELTEFDDDFIRIPRLQCSPPDPFPPPIKGTLLSNGVSSHCLISMKYLVNYSGTHHKHPLQWCCCIRNTAVPPLIIIIIETL